MADMTESAEWGALNDRQQSQAESIAELVLEYGKFDQSTGANGAHYAPAKVNPFKAEGMVCSNCVFFDELSNGCVVVTGNIEPDAICKLWVIPETSLNLNPQITREELKSMTDAEIMDAKAQGRLASILGN